MADRPDNDNSSTHSSTTTGLGTFAWLLVAGIFGITAEKAFHFGVDKGFAVGKKIYENTREEGTLRPEEMRARLMPARMDRLLPSKAEAKQIVDFAALQRQLTIALPEVVTCPDGSLTIRPYRG